MVWVPCSHLKAKTNEIWPLHKMRNPVPVSLLGSALSNWSCVPLKIQSVPGLRFLWFHTRIIYDFILSILDFLVRSLYETKEIIYDPCMITKKSYMILVRIPRIIHLFFENLYPFKFFCFYSVGHHIFDTPASHCDPPKDPNVQYKLQVGHKIKE